MATATYNTSGKPCPTLIMPKVCTNLETNYGLSENVYINLHILSLDLEGNKNMIYKGMCHIKLVETNENLTIMYDDSNKENIGDVFPEVNQITFPEYNESQIWIDPSTSPYVYNQCNTPPLDNYTVMDRTDNHITIEQHNTYITQNVYNYETEEYSPISEMEEEIITSTEPVANKNNFNMYKEQELECSLMLSKFSEDIMKEKKSRAIDERNFVEQHTANEALKQLMSDDIQSASKQHRTILFLGHDPESGQTVQNITVNDPMLECMMNGDVDNEIVIDGTNYDKGSKKYQCNKCKGMFDNISAFKQHMVGKHRSYSPYDIAKNIRLMCRECGKYLKSQKKLNQHYRGHGDPDLECSKCHKVFASKFTLRAHAKIHARKFPCELCTRSYVTAPELFAHKARVHRIYACDQCDWACDNCQDFAAHQHTHKVATKCKTSNYRTSTRAEENLIKSGDYIAEVFKSEEDMSQADQEIAKIKSTPIFRGVSKKKTRLYGKNCELCSKKFDRLSDLKRHLIEHVVRITLARNPVNELGVLNLCCEICQEKAFTRVDKYKAHLREHAKLTLYKCTFCDKSFSDSSNFSKHKKIHGSTSLQCDICQRKFNSKKMIIQHMEYHKKNHPLHCQFCSKIFYFKSSLNKHMKCTHFKECGSYKCTFCSNNFNSLKEKWDHEWAVHNVRKVVIDCLQCGSKFRKYAQLKRHCSKEHGIIIPTKTTLQSSWKRNKTRIEE